MKIAVVGGGISGVSAAYLLKRYTKHDVLLIEKENNLGGKAATFKEEGYTIETGPNGFLDNKEEIKKLIEESEFEDNVIESKDESRRRFIFSNGKLFELPENPIKLLYSGLLSFSGIANILKEPFVKPYMDDETLESFVARRLGKEMLDKLIGPMACGVYAGDPKHMSMDATFSKIKEIEREYGSLIKGMVALMKKRKAKASSAAGPFSAKLMSFKKGVGSFIDHLASEIAIVKKEALCLKKIASGYRICTKSGFIDADIIVFAIPSYALSSVLEKFDKEFSDTLNLIEYAPLSVVSLGFERNEMPDVVDSFGYLFNLNDIKDTIGVLFDSSIFDFRAEKNKVLVRLMVGGAIKKESAFRDDIFAVSAEEIQRSASIFKPFEYSHVKRHSMAIPQYGMNHAMVIKRVKMFEEKNKGVFILGNAFHGVSLNDCVKSSYEMLDKII